MKDNELNVRSLSHEDTHNIHRISLGGKFVLPIKVGIIFVIASAFLVLSAKPASGKIFTTPTPPSSVKIDAAKEELVRVESELQDLKGVNNTAAARLTVLNALKRETQTEYQQVMNSLKEQEGKLSGYAKKLYTEEELFRTSDLSHIAVFTSGPAGMAQLSRNQQFSDQFGGKDVQKLSELHSMREAKENKLNEVAQEQKQMQDDLIARNESIVKKSNELETVRAQLDAELEKYTDELLRYSCEMERETIRDNLETLTQYSTSSPQNSPQTPSDTTPPPPVTRFTSGSQIVNGKKIWDFFTARGFTPEATAGILGNLDQESRFNPAITQQPSGPGRGLAQWSAGGRWDTSKPNLVDYAKSKQVSPWDITTQLEFILLEMSIGWGGFDMESFKKETDILEATEYFHKVYERSADTSTFVRTVRGGYAEKWYTLFKNTTPRNDIITPSTAPQITGGTSNLSGVDETELLSPECRNMI